MNFSADMKGTGAGSDKQIPMRCPNHTVSPLTSGTVVLDLPNASVLIQILVLW